MKLTKLMDLQLFAEGEEVTSTPEGDGVQPETQTETPQTEEQPQEPIIDLDGEQVPLGEIKRWRDTRQNLEKFYYTKLNELKPYQELAEWLQQNPDIAQLLATEAEKKAKGQTTQSATPNQSLAQQPGESDKAYLARIERLEKQLQEFEQREMIRSRQQADKELEAEIRELKSKYKDFDEQEVLLTAYNNGLTNLEQAYWIVKGPKLAQQLPKIQEEAIAKYVKEKTSKTPPKVGGVSAGVPSNAQPIKTFAEARRAALSRLLNSK